MINSISKTVEEHKELINRQARIEYKRLPSGHVIDFPEVLNLAATAVYVVVTTHKDKEHNKSYLCTAIKWAVRNELRRRYRWYSSKQKNTEEGTPAQEGAKKSDIRESIYKAVLSIEELGSEENPNQMKDESTVLPDEYTALKELNLEVRKIIHRLPPRERKIIEARFFDDKKISTIADEYGVTTSRISRIIQTALDRIRKDLARKNIQKESFDL